MNTKKNILAIAVSALSLSPVLFGEGGDEGGGDEGTKTFTQEQLDAAISSAVNSATSGLETKNGELLGELKTLKTTFKKFDGVDLESLQNLQKQVESDEILKLHAEGKHDEAYNKRMEAERVTWNAQKETFEATIEEIRTGAKKNEELVNTLLIDGGAKTAFVEAKGLPTATDDIALRARQIWTVENGVPVARDEKGEMIQGEKGPLTMNEWAEGLKKTAPHLFPPSEGAGGNGGNGGDTGGDSIEAQILAASTRGDVKTVRELRKKLNAR